MVGACHGSAESRSWLFAVEEQKRKKEVETGLGQSREEDFPGWGAVGVSLMGRRSRDETDEEICPTLLCLCRHHPCI